MATGERDRGVWGRLSGMPLAARLELLEVLAAEASVRAEILSKMSGHPTGQALAELLRSLEREALIQPA